MKYRYIIISIIIILTIIIWINSYNFWSNWILKKKEFEAIDNKKEKFLSNEMFKKECYKIIKWENSTIIGNKLWNVINIYKWLLKKRNSFEYDLLNWKKTCNEVFDDSKYINYCNILFNKDISDSDKKIKIEYLYSKWNIYKYSYITWKAYLYDNKKICDNLSLDRRDDCLEQIIYFKNLFSWNFNNQISNMEKKMKNWQINLLNLKMEDKKIIPLVVNYKKYLDNIFIKECFTYNK